MADLARKASLEPEFVRRIEARFDGIPSPVLIEEWVRERFVYQSELFEVVRTPGYMLNWVSHHGWFSGDCDDVSTFLAAILKVYDYPAEFIAIRSQSPEFEHVFVRTDSFVLDPTVPYGTPYTAIEHLTQKV